MPRLRAGSAARIATVLVLVAGAGAVSVAQRFGVIEGAGAGIRVPPRDFNDGGFTVCKWMFRSDRSEPSGVGWSTDYPFGEINLLIRLSELTKVRVSRDRRGDVNYWVVRATDDQLFNCPILIGSDVGTAALSNAEVQRLREYLLKGGFLWVDDFWGTPAWDHWTSQIARVLPEFPIVDVAPADPMRQAMFPIAEVKQVPSIFSWGGPGSDPRERGSDSPHANFRAIADKDGRVMVAMTHNTDIGDSMEREGENPDYFAEYSPPGYALATNIVLYALTH
ncbi:MAG TPA: DUF4159 domain-containing protein [Vicinamibacterales bacterium]|nr:DUF4159 domain-containing protein [Vicinamibacterales bacterium]